MPASSSVRTSTLGPTLRSGGSAVATTAAASLCRRAADKYLAAKVNAGCSESTHARTNASSACCNGLLRRIGFALDRIGGEAKEFAAVGVTLLRDAAQRVAVRTLMVMCGRADERRCAAAAVRGVAAVSAHSAALGRAVNRNFA